MVLTQVGRDGLDTRQTLGRRDCGTRADRSPQDAAQPPAHVEGRLEYRSI